MAVVFKGHFAHITVADHATVKKGAVLAVRIHRGGKRAFTLTSPLHEHYDVHFDIVPQPEIKPFVLINILSELKLHYSKPLYTST